MLSETIITQRLSRWLEPENQQHDPGQVLKKYLREYQQSSFESLYWLVLSEKLQEGMQKAQEHFPQLPEYALYQFLLLYGFTEKELDLLHIQGQRTPAALESFFTPLVLSMKDTENTSKTGSNSISTGLVSQSVRHRSTNRQELHLNYFLAINLQSTRAFLSIGSENWHFPICGNHLRWNNKRYRWKTIDKSTKIAGRHLHRLLQTLFPVHNGFSYHPINDRAVKIQDHLTKSSFRLLLSLSAYSIAQYKLIKKALEEDLAKSREIMALSQEMRQAGKNGVEMLDELEEQKSTHDFVKYREMPLAIAHELDHWPEVFKSPFSHSYYNMEGKSWTETPDGILRISDHWNFQSHGSLHGKTNRSIPKGHWAIGKYSSTNQHYELLQSNGPDEKRREDFVTLSQRIALLKRYLL